MIGEAVESSSAADSGNVGHSSAECSLVDGAVCKLAKASLLSQDLLKCDTLNLVGNSESVGVQKRRPVRQLRFERDSSELDTFVQEGGNVESVTTTGKISSSCDAKISQNIKSSLAENNHTSNEREDDLALPTTKRHEERVEYRSKTKTRAQGFGSDVDCFQESADFQSNGADRSQDTAEQAVKTGLRPGLHCCRNETPALKALNPVKEESCAHRPDERITRTFYDQSQSFEFNPDKKHCPLWRNSRGEDESTEPDDPGFFEKCKQAIKSVFQRLSSTEFDDPTTPKRVVVQIPSGPVSFGCSLESVRRKDRKWFHYLHPEVPANSDSLTSQLGIQKHDEVLMLNGEVMVFIDNGQVLLKFKQILNSSSLDLVIRRQTSDQEPGKHFLFIRITTEINVNEEKIQAEDAQQVTSSNDIIWSKSDWTTINHDDQQLCVRSDRLALKDKDSGSPAVFRRTVFCARPNFNYYSVFKHRESGRFVTVADKKCILGPAYQTRPPTQVNDDRVFRLTEDDQHTCFIESVRYEDYYMALSSGDICAHGGGEHLCLHYTERPNTSDYVCWQLETPP